MIVHLHRFFLGLFRIVAVGIEFVDRVFTRFEDEKLALANELADLVDSQNDVLIDFPDEKSMPTHGFHPVRFGRIGVDLTEVGDGPQCP